MSPVRQIVYLRPQDAEVLRQLAEKFEGGNISRLVRRLIAEEADRRQLAKGDAA